MEFREYNNFQFASNDYLTETVQPQLDRLRRTTSVVLFRHGHRTPFKYRNTNDTKYTCYLESNFFSNLDPGWFEGKAEMMYDDVEICSYSTCEPIELNLQFDLNVKNDCILTGWGARQLKVLGSALKGRYQDELEDIKDDCSSAPSLSSARSEQGAASANSQQGKRKLLAISTRTERTIESLRSVLKGFFENEPVRPRVKVFVFEEENWLFVPYRAYPELSKGMEKAHSHNYKCDSIPGYSDWIEGWASRCKHVASALPHVDLQQTRDYLTSFKTFNMQSKCPIMNENDFEICNVLCAYAVSAESILVDKGLQKATGSYFEALLHLLTGENSESTRPRLCLLSAHDTTVNFIRLALRAQDFTWPDFGYSISFELYQDNYTNETKLMVLFNLRPVILHAIYPQALIPLPVFVQYVHSNLKM